MKSILALTVAVAGLTSITNARAADSIFIVYNGPAEYALRPSVPAASATPVATTERDTAPARKVRVVLPSPYSN